MRAMLVEPNLAVRDWWFNFDGKESFLKLVSTNIVVCDGWTALLVFLLFEELESIVDLCWERFQTTVLFIVTSRDLEDL